MTRFALCSIGALALAPGSAAQAHRTTRRVDVPASKITFARHGARRLREVMDGTRTELGRFPSFAGFVLHFAESYLALVGNVPSREGSDLQQESPGP